MEFYKKSMTQETIELDSMKVLGRRGGNEHEMHGRRSRVLFVDHTALLGGAELALLRLVRQIDQTRFDLSVVLFSDGPLADALVDAGAKVEVLPLAESVVKASRDAVGGSAIRAGTIWKTLRYVLRLADFIRDGGFDLVHTNSLKAGIIGGIAARLARRRLVWHLHDRVASDYMPSRVARVVRTLIRRVPHFLITNSQATLDTVAPYERSRCAVIYPGVSIDRIPRSVIPRRRAALVGLIGRISKTKGQDIFLRAAAIVMGQFPDVRFQIIGGALFNDQPFEEEVRTLVVSLGLEGVVELTGFVGNVEERIVGLDIIVHASPTAEPFGQVAVEGMAAGKPVIATRAGGIPEIVVHEESGLLVAPGSVEELATAMCRLLADPRLASQVAIRGRQRAVEKFSIERTAHEVEAVYERLLGAAVAHPGVQNSCEHLAA